MANLLPIGQGRVVRKTWKNQVKSCWNPNLQSSLVGSKMNGTPLVAAKELFWPKQQRVLRPKVVPHGLKLHGLRLGLKVEELCKGNSFASFQNQQESATALFTAHSQERRAFSYYIFPWIGTKKTKFTGSWNEFISSSGCVVHKLTMQDFQSDAK